MIFFIYLLFPGHHAGQGLRQAQCWVLRFGDHRSVGPKRRRHRDRRLGVGVGGGDVVGGGGAGGVVAIEEGTKNTAFEACEKHNMVKVSILETH